MHAVDAMRCHVISIDRSDASNRCSFNAACIIVHWNYYSMKVFMRI